jgi:hypothetical protein
VGSPRYPRRQILVVAEQFMTDPVRAPAALIALTALVAGSGLAPVPAQASESVASTASVGSSASLGSLSNSVGASSDSSTKTVAQAEGDYRVAAIEPAAERPGMLRLRLEPVGEGGREREAVLLFVPRAAAERGVLARDVLVTARQRPYGVEFSVAFGAGSGAGPGAEPAPARQAFYLVLHDEWYRELKARPVTL